MNLLARAAGTLQLMGFRVCRCRCWASLVALLRLIATPKLVWCLNSRNSKPRAFPKNNVALQGVEGCGSCVRFAVRSYRREVS